MIVLVLACLLFSGCAAKHKVGDTIETSNYKLTLKSDEKYEVRGVISLPNKVYEDKEGTIEFIIDGESFVVR